MKAGVSARTKNNMAWRPPKKPDPGWGSQGFLVADRAWFIWKGPCPRGHAPRTYPNSSLMGMPVLSPKRVMGTSMALPMRTKRLARLFFCSS